MPYKKFANDQEQFEYLLLAFVRSKFPWGAAEAKQRFKALLEWAEQKGIKLKRISSTDLNDELEIKPAEPSPTPETPSTPATPARNRLDEIEGRK